MSVPLAHFYHVYAAGDWKNIYDDHYACLETSGLLDALGKHFYVGLVGSFNQRQDAINYFATKPVSPVVVVEADDGWEQETIDALHVFSLSCLKEFYISYAHTKGATSGNNEFNVGWRNAMLHKNIFEWRDVIKFLDCGSHVVGCYWMTNFRYELPFFGGNFWWIKSSVSKLLGYSSKESRFDAEHWVSRAINFVPNAVITDLFPAKYASPYDVEMGKKFPPTTRPFIEHFAVEN